MVSNSLKNRGNYRGRADFKPEPPRSPRVESKRSHQNSKAGPRRYSSRAPRKEDTLWCYEYYRSGHIAINCPAVKCFEFEEKGNVARACPWIYKGNPTPEPMSTIWKWMTTGRDVRGIRLHLVRKNILWRVPVKKRIRTHLGESGRRSGEQLIWRYRFKGADRRKETSIWDGECNPQSSTVNK